MSAIRYLYPCFYPKNKIMGFKKIHFVQLIPAHACKHPHQLAAHNNTPIHTFVSTYLIPVTSPFWLVNNFVTFAPPRMRKPSTYSMSGEREREKERQREGRRETERETERRARREKREERREERERRGERAK